MAKQYGVDKPANLISYTVPANDSVRSRLVVRNADQRSGALTSCRSCHMKYAHGET